MSELSERMDAIKVALAARYPLRVVTRDLLPPQDMKKADLEKGVYTVTSRAEEGFTNVSGYEAKDGRQTILLFGDILPADPKISGEALENLEFTMRDEIIAFLQNLPAPLCAINAKRFAHSGQMDRPNGWIVFELEYLP